MLVEIVGGERVAGRAGEQETPDRLTPHGLRHTFATVMLYLGKEAGYTAQQMGHADAGFTYSRYYRRFSALPGERERVEALIGGSVSGLADVLDMTPVA